MPSIFISYRRDDSFDVAGRIYDRLADHFGRESVFMDVDTIPIGIDFRKYLQDAVGRCDILLAVIGEGWLRARLSKGPSRGQRRLDDPADFVRIEIASALDRDIPVVPVLVGRATMPVEKDLPDGLKELAFRNAAEARPGKDFHDHIDRLIRGIESIRGIKSIRGIESLEQPIDVTVPGEWLARLADEPHAKWARVRRTPRKLSLRPGEVYRLKFAEDVTADELAGLADLKGLASFRSLDLSACEQVKDSWLAHLEGFSSLQSLDMYGCDQVTDSGLVHLKGLASLQSLVLSCNKVTDLGLVHLRGLASLQSLDLSCSKVTDRGLAHLRGLTSLQSLVLSECQQVTGGGLAHLQGLASLQSLDLCGCKQMTDCGLAHLKGLASLQTLNLTGCSELTDDGVAELKRALPNCEVRR